MRQKRTKKEGNLPNRGNIYGDPGLQAKRMPVWLEPTEGQASGQVSEWVGRTGEEKRAERLGLKAVNIAVSSPCRV